MSAKRTFPYVIFVSFLMLLINSCNMPSKEDSISENPGLIHTIAAQTVEVQLTLDSELQNQASPTDDVTSLEDDLELPTNTPTMTEVFIPTETPLPSPTNTPVPSPTKIPIPCDRGKFVKDITIPDRTVMTPGQKFTKTWRLKNDGSCTWTSGYSVVFVSGDAMGAPASIQLTSGSVAPGEEFDVSLNLEAPLGSGTYKGNFKLRNATGTVFGLGDNSSSFYVEVVVESVSGVMVDFLASAEEAVWGRGTGTITYNLPGEFALPYGGPLGGTEAYVTTHKNIRLEDGSTSGAILETHPENNGYIIGRYSAYTVGGGDYIKAKIGFLAEDDGSCGSGDVIFQINYTIGDDLATMASLGSWNETCDGKFRKINIDLSSLIGKTVRFYLIVSANGVATGDKAIWDSLGVIR